MKILDSIVENISNDILQGKYGKSGDRFPPIRDLADKLNISYVTAQKAYRRLHNLHLLFTIEKKTYIQYEAYHQDSDYAKTKTKSKFFGLYVYDIDNPFYSRLTQELSFQLSQKNYTLIILSNAKNPAEEKEKIQALFNLGVEGIFCCPLYEYELSDFYHRFILPIVFLSRKMETLDFNTVSVNNSNIGRQVANHLIDSGYTEFIYIGQRKRVSDFRLSGFISELRLHGIELNKNHIFYADPTSIDENILKNLYNLAASSKNRVGIFCYHDLLAGEIHKFLKSAQIEIQQKIGLVGVDNLQFTTYLSPAITTISYSYANIISVAIVMMENILQSTEKQQPIQYLNQSLNIRESTRTNL